VSWADRSQVQEQSGLSHTIEAYNGHDQLHVTEALGTNVDGSYVQLTAETLGYERRLRRAVHRWVYDKERQPDREKSGARSVNH
jgi:hypothetical protein